jgi:hypothetical protein
MLDLAPEYVRMVRGIVATHAGTRRVIVFGSRGTRRAKRLPDVALATAGPAFRAEAMARYEALRTPEAPLG